MSPHRSTALVLLLALSGVAGCAQAAPHERVVGEEQIIVNRAPPPLRGKIIVAAPGPVERFVWQPGHWRWDGRVYDWVAGRWIERPSAAHVWAPAHWVERPSLRWQFVPGHWRR